MQQTYCHHLYNNEKNLIILLIRDTPNHGVKGELGGLFRYLIEKNAASFNEARDVRKINEEDVHFERQTMTEGEIAIVKDYS